MNTESNRARAATAERELRILRVDASMRYAGSVSRQLSGELIQILEQNAVATGKTAVIKVRDLAQGVELINEAWIVANNTDPAQRNSDQRAVLCRSDALVAEVQWADVLVIGTPMYNFAPPAALKAWIDQVARAGLTFRYSENGPVGLLENKRAFVVISGGGVAVGSAADFVSGYLRQYLGFIGIDDVELVVADRLVRQADASLRAARESIMAIGQRGGAAAAGAVA